MHAKYISAPGVRLLAKPVKIVGNDKYLPSVGMSMRRSPAAVTVIARHDLPRGHIIVSEGGWRAIYCSYTTAHDVFKGSRNDKDDIESIVEENPE